MECRVVTLVWSERCNSSTVGSVLNLKVQSRDVWSLRHHSVGLPVSISVSKRMFVVEFTDDSVCVTRFKFCLVAIKENE